MVRAFMIRYKFKINENYNHSDYGYQKIFRAIYGYTQVVTKGSGKKYVYHRPGVLSTYPFVKKGKNEVILTKDGFSRFTDFLKTGINPAHRWNEKGNWTATYTMYDVDLSEQQVEIAVADMIKSTYVVTPDGLSVKIMDILESIYEGKVYDESILKMYDDTARRLQSSEWYSVALKNQIVSRFDNMVKVMRSNLKS